MKSKPDDRRDNVKKLQRNINYTIRNIELADEMIDKITDEKMKKDLSDKNDRREQALDGMRSEIQDEAKNQERDSN